MMQSIDNKIGLFHMINRVSPHFKTQLENMIWEGRKQTLFEKSSAVLLEYVDDSYQKSGVGKRLVENTVSWLNPHGVETQKLSVGVGNEQVLDFYKKFDFYPVHIVLQKRNTI